MKFHYHRGWTLSQLGRFDEALADFSEGLKTQPDYAWAYVRRGCANASVGQLAEALADMDMAVLKYAQYMTGEGPGVRHDKAEFIANSQRLKAAMAGGEHKPIHGLCDNFWGDNGKPRSLSVLLRKPE
jgi:tetratricopeptide (TPR) repeat protein